MVKDTALLEEAAVPTDHTLSGVAVAGCASPESLRGLRVLVVIASYGERNLPYLRRVVDAYQSMSASVDIVVVSEAPKHVAPGVEVRVGLPDPNPWSLPFAHKQIFADRRDQYDLFVYSEDDILVTEGNVRAFLEAERVLEPTELAGFLRYETDAVGTRWMPDVHGVFHWKVDSSRWREGRAFAAFTNEHAACYMLTKRHLSRALASGGFMVAPYEGRYDMLCAAATDPYTQCGFEKVVDVTNLSNAVVHHLSNRYAGTVGTPMDAVLREVSLLIHPSTEGARRETLCEVETHLPRTEFCKGFDEPSTPQVKQFLPDRGALLSIGAGRGAFERDAQGLGLTVTVIPLNSLIGDLHAANGLAVVYGTLDDCLETLDGRTFDCVVISNLLHLQRGPGALLTRAARLVRDGGHLLIASPNFGRVHVRGRRMLRKSGYERLRSFDESRVSTVTPKSVGRWVRDAGLTVSDVVWTAGTAPRHLRRYLADGGPLTAEGWVMRAVRTEAARTARHSSA